jgi:hypothetical protein
MRGFLFERLLVVILLLVGTAGLLVAVVLVLREGSWVSSPGVPISGLEWFRAVTAACGVAWFVLFWGVAAALELLMELLRRDSTSH